MCSVGVARRIPVLLAAALALGGCARRSAVEDGVRTGTFLYAIGSEPSDLDPAINISGDEDIILRALYEGLVTMSGDGHTIQPGMAERWEVSADGKMYTFHLRPDARWSNGAALTAEDFVYSFRREFEPQLAAEEASFGYCIAGAEAYNEGKSKDPASIGVRAPDARTFVVTLTHPTPYFLGICSLGSPFMPVFRPLVEQFGGSTRRDAPWTREGRLVSNGPFMLQEWKQDKVLTVVRNPSYWDSAHVRLNAIRFFPVTDYGGQEMGFRAGQFHATQFFPIHKRADYTGARANLLKIDPGLDTHMITFNVGLAALSDARVRRALSLAIDRDTVIPAIFGPFADPAHSFGRDGAGGYRPPSSSACLFDPSQAQRLLAAAGYPGGKGFPRLDLMLVGNDRLTIQVGEAVQAAWSRVLGVETQLLPTEMKVYLDAERTKHYQAIIERWGYTWDDPSGIFMLCHGDDPNNDAGWVDVRFDQAYAAAENTTDPAQRRRAFDVQEAEVASGVPYAPLYHANQGMLVLPIVQGWALNQLNFENWKELGFSGL